MDNRNKNTNRSNSRNSNHSGGNGSGRNAGAGKANRTTSAAGAKSTSGTGNTNRNGSSVSRNAGYSSSRTASSSRVSSGSKSSNGSRVSNGSKSSNGTRPSSGSRPSTASRQSSAAMSARRKRKKRERILRNVGLVLSSILLVITIAFIVMMNIVDLLPPSYELLIATLLVLIVAFTFVTQRWVSIGIVTKVLSVILSITLVVGCVYLDATHKALKKMSDDNTVTSIVGVYVLADNQAEKITDLDGKTCGKLTSLDKENTDKLVEHIKTDAKISLSYKNYDGIAQLVEALYKKEVEAVIFNGSYLGILQDISEYSNFESKTRCIYTKEYKTQINNNGQQSNEDHIITMYISGIDTRTGDVKSNSNSDVNILCIANLKTHQILLINTPRDYFIPTSVSNGEKDKLTHAGVYGVDCSVDTLELLYDMEIDYYFKVNFTGFIDIIDQLGGITVRSEFDFVTTHGGDHIVVGDNYLTGKQALGFVRERYAFALGDRQRGKNTMTVIKAVINKMASSALLTNYTGVLESISDSMVTNMSYEKIGELAKMQINSMPSWDVQQYSVNGTGATKSTFSYKPPVYVMIPDQETVDQAKTYIKALCSDQTIKVEQ